MTWHSRQLAQQNGRTFVITGANSGIGLEAARDLTSRGAHVILAVRDVGKGEQARRTLPEPGTSSVVELDLADLDSVASGAKALAAEHSSVSALVCNAAARRPTWPPCHLQRLNRQPGGVLSRLVHQRRQLRVQRRRHPQLPVRRGSSC